MTADPVSFRAQLIRAGGLPCVHVPEALSGALATDRHPRVEVELGGHRFVRTLVARGGGHWRLHLDSAIRKEHQLAEGDEFELTLRSVGDEPAQPPPDDLAVALDRVEDGLAVFDRLPRGMRREILTWLEAAKKPVTRENRIERIVESISDRERRGR